VTCVGFWGENYAVSGSWDHRVLMWDLQSQSLVKVFDAHTDFVKSLVVTGDIMFTGSSDRHIRKWDLKTGKSLQVLEGHTRGIEDLKVADGFLFSASSDSTIKKWRWQPLSLFDLTSLIFEPWC